jgi:hypothetical protein
MRTLFLLSCVGLFVAAAVACRSETSDGDSAGADLSAGDGGAPLTPIQAAQQKLAGAWVAPGPDGPVAYVISDQHAAGMEVERDTPHKTGVPQAEPSARDATTHTGQLLRVDASGGGTMQLKQFVFVGNVQEHRVETYQFALATAGGSDTLTLTETTEALFKDPPFGSDAGATAVDAGPIALRPTIVLTRQPSFCGALGDFDCTRELGVGVFHPSMPAPCQGREDICLRCNTATNACEVKVPSSCELSRFTCVESMEKCEFAERTGATSGQVTDVDPDGNPVDCNGSPSKQPICCENLSRGGD